jgi:octaprenyl-diphosphate synthase
LRAKGLSGAVPVSIQHSTLPAKRDFLQANHYTKRMEVKEYLQKELPLINSTLEAELEGLHSSVREVAKYTLSAGGKRLRPLLTILMARSLGYHAKNIYPLACALEFLHSATLMHDDILDNAHLRRGQTSAHLIFGLTQTVLAGDGLLALANMIVARYNMPALTHCVADAILKTATGEIEEIYWLRKPDLTKDTYLQIIKGKTAYLIQAACLCGAIIAGADDYIQKQSRIYGLNLGIAFQLVDDALDYTSTSAVSGKPLGGDLREGKLTLPLILYLKNLKKEHRQKILSRIAENSLSDEEVEEIITAIQNKGLARRVRQEARTFLQKSEKALANFPETQEKELLKKVLYLVLSRDR